jgi:hypothetical protein
MTAVFTLDAVTGRVVLVILVIVLALVLHLQGQDLATALLVAAAGLALAGEVAHRILAKESR